MKTLDEFGDCKHSSPDRLSLHKSVQPDLFSSIIVCNDDEDDDDSYSLNLRQVV